jgi:hypothetical protein
MAYYVSNTANKIKNNPELTRTYVEYGRSGDDEINLSDHDFKLAFDVRRVGSGESIYEPGYLEWFAYFIGRDEDRTRFRELIKVRKCTPEDWEDFHEPL